LVFSGNVINSIALKNSLNSVTNNTIEFFLVLVFINVMVIIIHYLTKTPLKDKNFYAMTSIFSIAIAFVTINSAFERLVYYLIPLSVIFFSPYISMIKNKTLVTFILLFLSITVCTYSLNHPSVTNNFINL
jgi:hypothetical protein